MISLYSSTSALARSCSFRHSCRFLSAQRNRLDIAIVGAPNAGKSQLLNVVCQAPHLAAVSKKRHTTKTCDILGTRTIETKNSSTQLVFWDTPGYMRSSAESDGAVGQEFDASIRTALDHVDYTLIVVDAARNLELTKNEPYKESIAALMLHALEAQGQRVEDYVGEEDELDDGPVVVPSKERFGLVLNKVDLIRPKEKLLEIVELLFDMAERAVEYYLEQQQALRSDEEGTSEHEESDLPSAIDLFPCTFYTDALSEEGTDDIVTHLQKLATPSRAWAMEPEQEAAMSSSLKQQRVEEVVREKVFRILHKELPHQVTLVVKGFWDDAANKRLKMDMDLVVRRKSQKVIIEGHNLAQIQQTAVRDLQDDVFPDYSLIVLNLAVKFQKAQHLEGEGDNITGTVAL